jgi:hypothetical protein
METVPGVERFAIPGCGHAFCAGCVRQYIAARVEENLLAVGCPDPGCRDGVLHPEECRHVLPSPLFHRWGAALCDMALEEIKLYCIEEMNSDWIGYGRQKERRETSPRRLLLIRLPMGRAQAAPLVIPLPLLTTRRRGQDGGSIHLAHQKNLQRRSR